MKRLTIVNDNSSYVTWAAKAIGGIIGALLGYFQVIIIANKALYAAITAVAVFDFAIGLLKSIRLDNEGFSPTKAVGTLYVLGGHCALVTVIIMVEAVHPNANWLTETIAIPLLIFTIMGTMKNMELLGMIKSKALTWIFSNVEKHKNDMVNAAGIDTTQIAPEKNNSNPENLEG